MAKPLQAKSSMDSVPAQLPQTTPLSYAPADHSFTMQTFMEIQKNLGQLNQAVITLTEESKKGNTKLDEVSHKVYAAQVTIGVVGSILAAISGGALFLFWKIWDAVYPILLTKPHH
jgi:hypothetical protein